MPEFKKDAAARLAKKEAELAPYIAAALKRKKWMQVPPDDQIPPVRASVAEMQIDSIKK